MHRSFASALVAVTAITGVAAMTPAVASADPSDPLASATYGKSEIVLRKDPAGAGRLQLAYAAEAGQPPVAVDAELPAGIKRRDAAVGLGLDARGLLTAVVQAPKGIYWVHVTRPDGVRRLAGTTGGESPAIFHGQVAYTCEDDRAVCGASLRTKARRVLFREPKGSPWFVDEVRIGDDRTIAIDEVRDGALGASQIRIKAVGGKPRRVATSNLDSSEEISLRDISPDGAYLSLVRSDYGNTPTTETLELVSFPSGQKLVS